MAGVGEQVGGMCKIANVQMCKIQVEVELTDDGLTVDGWGRLLKDDTFRLSLTDVR
jgi:hypothetical protein